MNTLSDQQNRIQNIIRILCIAAAAAMIVISITVYGASVPGYAVMVLFLLVYMILPGLLIIKAAGLDKGQRITTLALALFAGWSIDLILYFINDLTGSNILLYTVCPLLSGIYLVKIIRDRSEDPFRGWKPLETDVWFCVFMALILLYCLLDTQYQYLAPELSDFTYMNPDKAYHLGLVNSLSHDYPLESPWINGRIITYHIFGEMLFSIPVRLFGLETDFVSFSFGPLMTAFTFGISLCSFFTEMTEKKERAGLYCMILLLSNIYMTRNLRSSLAFKFILENDNSAGYGIAAVLMTIVIFDKWYGSFEAGDKKHRIEGIICLLFIMLTTGIKGPMGAVTVGALWGTFLLGMIMRKMPLRSILPLMAYTCGFVLVYFTVLGSKGQTNGGGNSIISFASISNIAFWKKPLIEFLKSIGMPYSVRLMMVMVVFLIFFFTVYFLPFCIGYIRELFMVLSGRKAYEPARVLVYAECAVGFIAMFLLNYSGHSQVYFGLVTVFLAPVVAYWFMEDMEDKAKSPEPGRSGTVFKICAGCMCICLVLTTASLGVYYCRHIGNAVEAADPGRTYNKYLSISNDEYQAMEWLENNTDEDALLATDRYYSVSLKKYSYENRWDNRFFLYPVYANRYSYISGSGYNLPAAEWTLRRDMIEKNMELYDPENEDRGEEARELGVDYVVVSKRFTDAEDLTNGDYSLCYTNDDVDIYEIKQAS